jgi:uncharacterized protein
MSDSERREAVALLARLKSAEGHLHAVIGMVESGTPCEQVLHQLNAICGALRAAEHTLVQCQLHASFQIITEDSHDHIRLAEVQRLTRLYGQLVRHPLVRETVCDDSTNKH